MLTCPNCQAGVPEGMRFCLQCGAALALNPSGALPAVEADPSVPASPAKASPTPPFTPLSTVNLKIAPTPVMSPRTAPRAQHPRPRLGDDIEEIDEEALKKSFERRVVRPGAVVCRFCKGPLDLGGEYCDQCGAPLAEAAPPGTLPVKPQPAAPPALLDDDPLSPLAAPGAVSAFTRRPYDRTAPRNRATTSVRLCSARGRSALLATACSRVIPLVACRRTPDRPLGPPQGADQAKLVPRCEAEHVFVGSLKSRI